MGSLWLDRSSIVSLQPVKKLLNSDMRESNEGIVRLEMLSEVFLRDILEFIYTGNVQMSANDNAQDLIAMADYFDLPQGTLEITVLYLKLLCTVLQFIVDLCKPSLNYWNYT